MFNSEEYAWSDVQIQMLGRPVGGARSVMYKVTQTKTNIYARGNKPRARTRGNKEYEGELGLLQSEVEALQATLRANQDLLDLGPFDIVVSYAPAGGTIKTDILKDCEFTELEKGMEQNDENMQPTLPLIIGDVKYNQ